MEYEERKALIQDAIDFLVSKEVPEEEKQHLKWFVGRKVKKFSITRKSVLREFERVN